MLSRRAVTGRNSPVSRNSLEAFTSYDAKSHRRVYSCMQFFSQSRRRCHNAGKIKGFKPWDALFKDRHQKETPRKTGALEKKHRRYRAPPNTGALPGATLLTAPLFKGVIIIGAVRLNVSRTSFSSVA